MERLRVVATGSRGLLGSTVMTTLAARGHEAVAFPGDITNAEDVQSFITHMQSADVLIHAAAATDVNRCEQEPEWATRVNVEGTRLMRDAATALGARFVYVSTVSVFDGVKGDAREEDATQPGNVYNRTKEEGERIAREAPSALIVRLNLIGVHPNGSRGKNVIEWVLNAIRDGKDMQLFTDVRINPLSNHTAADLIIEAIERKVPGPILHLGTRDVWSKAAIGAWFVDRSPSYTGNAVTTTSDALSALANRPKEMWLNVERAAVVFGRPMPTVEQELERIWSLR